MSSPYSQRLKIALRSLSVSAASTSAPKRKNFLIVNAPSVAVPPNLLTSVVNFCLHFWVVAVEFANNIFKFLFFGFFFCCLGTLNSTVVESDKCVQQCDLFFGFYFFVCLICL